MPQATARHHRLAGVLSIQDVLAIVLGTLSGHPVIPQDSLSPYPPVGVRAADYASRSAVPLVQLLLLGK